MYENIHPEIDAINNHQSTQFEPIDDLQKQLKI